MDLVVYQVFARTLPRYGTLARVAADVPRLRALGVDVVYLLPVHPPGRVGRKGARGSPYAAQDWRAVEPELGTREDVAALAAAVHAAGMRLLFDAVLNHTAKDSVLAQTHPEWFLPGLACRVPAWSDVADLDYTCPDADALVAEVTDTLRGWLALGVDGFRCDVAGMLPEPVWRRILGTLRAEFPHSLWIAESFKPKHTENAGSELVVGDAAGTGGRRPVILSDTVLLRHFDLAYDYTLFPLWVHAAHARAPLEQYLDHLRMQLMQTPQRLRFVENHDTRRLVASLPPRAVRLWLALFTLLPGAVMVYHGLETFSPTTPTLFDTPTVDDGAAAAPFADLAAVLALKAATAACDQTYFVALDPLVLVRRNSLTGAGVHAVLRLGLSGGGGVHAAPTPPRSMTPLLVDSDGALAVHAFADPSFKPQSYRSHVFA